jgi:hypothetical protein
MRYCQKSLRCSGSWLGPLRYNFGPCNEILRSTPPTNGRYWTNCISVRSCMTLWVQWFTFFVTINYVGLGWFAQEIVKNGSLRGRRPLIYVSMLLMTQCVLGIWVSLLLRQWFLRTNRELLARYDALPSSPKPPVFPILFYGNAICLACLALAALILCWAWLAVRPYDTP